MNLRFKVVLVSRTLVSLRRARGMFGVAPGSPELSAGSPNCPPVVQSPGWQVFGFFPAGWERVPQVRLPHAGRYTATVGFGTPLATPVASAGRVVRPVRSTAGRWDKMYLRQESWEGSPNEFVGFRVLLPQEQTGTDNARWPFFARIDNFPDPMTNCRNKFGGLLRRNASRAATLIQPRWVWPRSTDRRAAWHPFLTAL